MRLSFCQFLGVAALAASCSAVAGTNGFIAPAFRGQPDTTFTGWESFTVGIGEPGNAGDLPGSNNSARFYQTAPGAMVLGSGNIYNGADKSQFEVRYTAASQSVGLVSLQIRTLGTELSYDSLKLVGAGDTGPITLTATRTELDRISFGPPPPNPGSGVGVSSLWQWDLSGLGVDYFSVSVAAAEINLSLDSATLDVQLVPEPTVVPLAMLGGALLMLCRRNQR
ncbi:MAG: PEP-CTERM sorting domain-containing protein [Verrucomicrobiales bacterium]|nr:PEP-CTERM sorting domain-containing protein [Verrucomicrobiales bacterium]